MTYTEGDRVAMFPCEANGMYQFPILGKFEGGEFIASDDTNSAFPVNDIDAWFYRIDKIKTDYVFPPIPDRNHDYCASLESGSDEFGPFGWGATEQAAIAALISNLECE